jgi:hypothetical protein
LPVLFYPLILKLSRNDCIHRLVGDDNGRQRPIQHHSQGSRNPQRKFTPEFAARRSYLLPASEFAARDFRPSPFNLSPAKPIPIAVGYFGKAGEDNRPGVDVSRGLKRPPKRTGVNDTRQSFQK